MRFLNQKLRARLWGKKKSRSSDGGGRESSELDRQISAVLGSLPDDAKQDILRQLVQTQSLRDPAPALGASNGGRRRASAPDLQGVFQGPFSGRTQPSQRSNTLSRRARDLLEGSDAESESSFTGGGGGARRPSLSRASALFTDNGGSDGEEDVELSDAIDKLQEQAPVPSLDAILALKDVLRDMTPELFAQVSARAVAAAHLIASDSSVMV
eukprot:TRINITY_DN6147_c0_g1_i2.p1 TRINITY_DN6147_c0_g1~~TRINITY_DN6147_c0_g1_i2.p1  ORF type:complete len:212 (-),score=59.58 TRINITY_DN6147_c0_g1_i2:63-698(-)